MEGRSFINIAYNQQSYINKMGNLLNLLIVHLKETPFYQSLHFEEKTLFPNAADKEQKQEEPLLFPLTISMCKHEKELH